MPAKGIPPTSTSPDLAVVGGGIVGLSVAWRAAQRGLRVVVLEAGTPGRGASHVAAGMLAPVAEVEGGRAGRRLLELSLAAAERWPGDAAELAELTGREVGLRDAGTLMVAADADEAEALDREVRFREQLGLDVDRLVPSAARRLEPALAPRLRGAAELPGDRSVDPRLAVEALVAAVRGAGCEVRGDAPVEAVARDEVRLAGGERLAAGRVVVAAGAWADRLVEGLGVRPVKGQLLRLRDPGGPGLVTRVLRAERVYLVPRADGRYVLGATVEERGFDTTVTAGALYELLRHATALVPGIDELVVEETIAGLRPMSPDGVPLIGEVEPGVVVAAGHGRNGVLLAPLTGELVAGLLAGEPADPLLETCDPARLGAPRALAEAPA